MLNKPVFLLIFALFFNQIFSQNKVDSTYVRFTNQKIIIDGIDDEIDWEKAELKSDFWQWFPTDSIKALKQTEIKFLYDSNNIYAFIKCYENKDETIISSLRRDMGRFSDFFLFLPGSFPRFFLQKPPRNSPEHPPK